MPKSEHSSITKTSPKLRLINPPKALEEAEARHVKIVVFDDQNRVLAIQKQEPLCFARRLRGVGRR